MSYQGQLKIRLIILIFFWLEALHLGEQLLFITLFDTTSVLKTICFLELGLIFDPTYSALKSTQVKYILRKLWEFFGGAKIYFLLAML